MSNDHKFPHQDTKIQQQSTNPNNFFLLNFSEVIDGVPEKEYEMGLL